MGAMVEIIDGNPMLLKDPTLRDWHQCMVAGGESAFQVTMDVINSLSQMLDFGYWIRPASSSVLRRGTPALSSTSGWAGDPTSNIKHPSSAEGSLT
jgi:hypothetical protein